MNKESRRTFHGRRGQTTLIVLLVLGTFLFGFIALAVDFSNLWFHRQTAQSAADSACIAAGADMLAHANSITTTLDSFIPPAGAASGFDCSSYMSLAPCQYAKINKVDATGGLQTNAESKQVHISFPSSIDGVVTDPGVTNIAGPNPYVRATVTDRTRVYFARLFTGNATQDVAATAACGLILQKAPIPLIVLHPYCAHAFETSGSASLKIVGGPIKSVQVNSNNTTCAAATMPTGCSGNGTVDLSEGGPSFNGSEFGVTGTPGTAPPGFIPGANGSWANALPIADPYANTPEPSGVSDAPAPQLVNYGSHGCPDQSQQCWYYQPGVYHKPIVVKGETAIFAPGVYVIAPDSFSGLDATGTHNGDASGGTLCGNPSVCESVNPTGQCRADFLVESGGVVRPAVDGGDPKAGAMFYLSSGTSTGTYGSAVFTSNAGTSSRTIDPFTTSNMVCNGGTAPDYAKLGIPPTLTGNVLQGECTAAGTYVGSGSTDTTGTARGLLFFQNRANGDSRGQMNMQGGGGLLLSGTLYAHNLATNPQAFIQLQGTPGSGTYVFGEIVTDQFVLSGNGEVAMQLSTDATLDVLKVQLLQ